MLTLALIGLLGGLVTGISPCILPVLPVILVAGGAQSARGPGSGRTRPESAAGAERPDPTGAATATATTTTTATTATTATKTAATTGTAAPVLVSRWRPYWVILGLVVSFSVITLVGSLLLSLLGLPQDVLRWAGIVVLTMIGVGLIVPAVEALLEKPFRWIPTRSVTAQRSGFGLGFALGAVYVPCAGPVLAAITVAGSTGRIGWETVVLTAFFAIGAAVPLLFFALAGRRVAERVKAFRTRQRGIRIAGGAAMIVLAVALAFNLPAALQRAVPDYTSGLQEQIAESDAVRQALDLGGLVNDENRDLDKCSNGGTELESCGTAPAIRDIASWFNTPGDRPLELAELRGKVVLVDFWAYSCINCQRSVPHIAAWYQAYRESGLEVIGVHSPEYAFEKERPNVISGAADLGITYPVALDNSLGTWTNFRNRYWPAHYLIDAAGTVRHVKLGEGGYADTERHIRELLTLADPDVALPAPTELADRTPEAGSTTPETFLGATKAVNYAGEQTLTIGRSTFDYPAEQAGDTYSLDGDWDVGSQSVTPGSGPAGIRLQYTARTVRLVLAGTGAVTVDSGGESRTIDVDGTPRSYEVVAADGSGSPSVGELELVVSSGVTVYSFTFG